jgi:hypothetical protein
MIDIKLFFKNIYCFDWLIDWLVFYVNFSSIFIGLLFYDN